jgi:hypothetical protein
VQFYSPGLVDTALIQDWSVAHVLASEGLALQAGSEQFSEMLAAVEEALGPYATLFLGADVPVHQVIRLDASVAPEAHLGKILSVLNKNLQNRLTFIAPAEYAVAFQNYLKSLKHLPGFVLDRISVERMEDERSVIRWIQKTISSDDNQVGVLDRERRFLNRLGYVRNGIRFLADELDENTAAALTPTLIRELGPEAQFIIQRVQDLMRRYGIDAADLERYLAHAIEVMQSYMASA